MSAADTVRESVLVLECEGETLQGVLALPAAGQCCSAVGVVIVVGGPQIRIGSHRQFVALARRLAAEGHAVLRFDARGMGDSTGTAPGFDALQPDIRVGITALLRTPGVQRAVLWGLCDGASASLLYAGEGGDQRLAGLVLLNPWVRSAQSLAQTQVKHYYRARLFEPALWAKLLRGRVGLRAVRDLVGNVMRLLQPRSAADAPTFQQRMAAGWCALPGSILVLLSAEDWTAREFEDQFHNSSDWAAARRRTNVSWERIAGADHTLSTYAGRTAAEDATAAWLRALG